MEEVSLGALVRGRHPLHIGKEEAIFPCKERERWQINLGKGERCGASHELSGLCGLVLN